MKKIWLISDTHFNHARVKEYENRPDNFEELIWKNLKQIEQDDTLIHLGDFSLGKELDYHKILETYQFKKILVRGNHDSKSNNWYLEHGWDFICREFSDKLYGKKILFTHEPALYDLERYDLNIHGHLHANRHRGSNEDFIFKGRTYKLISCEFQNYKPILLEKLI